MKRFILFALFLFFTPLVVFSETTLTLNDVQTAIISEDYVQAKKLSEQLLEVSLANPARYEVQYYLGLSSVRLGEYQAARKVFEELSQKQLSQSLEDKVLLGLFDSYYMNEEYTSALKIVNKLLRRSPNSKFLSLIYLKAARCNLKLSRWAKAGEYLEKITANFPDSLEYYTARQLLQEKQYFTVQVGAFIDRGMAEKVLKELQKKNQYGYIVETVDRQDRVFYRVRVGELASITDANQLKKHLSMYGFPAQIYP